MTFRVFKIDQAENDGGAADGGSGSQPGGDAGAGAGAGAPAAGAGDGAGAASPAGNGGEPSAAEQIELELEPGQKTKMPLKEAVALIMQGRDYTKKTQEIAQLRKKYTQGILRADELMKEALKGKPPAEEDPEGDAADPLKTVQQRVDELTAKESLRDWENFFAPIKQKYPDLDGKELAAKFVEKLHAGDVDETPGGLEVVAAELATERESVMGARLDKMLADEKNPKVIAAKQKWIADYLAGKIKHQDAGGDNGRGAAGHAPDKKESLEEIAERIRSAA